MIYNAAQRAVACLLLVCSPTTAGVHAQSIDRASLASMSYAAVFASDEVLEATRREIGTLRLRAVEALARAMADCDGGLSKEELTRAPCLRSEAYFRIVAPREGALSYLFDLVGLRSATLLGSDVVGIRSEEDRSDVQRIRDIRTSWAAAIRERFETLDGQSR